MRNNENFGPRPNRFAASLEAEILLARPGQLDVIGRDLWAAYARGDVPDSDAEALTALIEARRGARSAVSAHGNGSIAAVAGIGAASILSRFKPRRVQRSPDREASLRRRRGLARSSPLPQQLACQFTEGQCAALAVIGGEVKHHGVCDLPLDKIAALAGVCRTTARNAINEAKRVGLVRVTSRPRPGQKNLTNVVEIISPEWRTWLKRGPTAHRPTGCKTVSASKILRPTMSTERKIAFEGRAEAGLSAPAKGEHSGGGIR